MDIGEKVRKVRELKQLSQEEMAHKLHMTPNNYAKLERGEIKMRVERLEQIANIFNMDAGDLLSLDKKNFIYIIDNEIGNLSANNDMYNFQDLTEILAQKDKLIEQQAQQIEQQAQQIKFLSDLLLSLQNK